MLRWMVLAALAFTLWRILDRALMRRLAGSGQRPGRMASSSSAASSEPLVRCDICNVHVPRSRALSAPSGGSGVYCSEACRRAGISGVF